MAERKNRTPTDLVNAILDTSVISPRYGRGGDIECISSPKLSSHKEQRNDFIRGIEKKGLNSLIMDLGLFGDSGCANSRKAQAWTKKCELCFSGLCCS
jgi:hypothetical protein